MIDGTHADSGPALATPGSKPDVRPVVPPADESLARAAKLAVLWRLVRRRAAEGHLPVARQMIEMAYLYVARGLSPTYYCSGALYERGMPWRHKRDHITARTYRRRLERINERRFRFLTQNKVVTSGMLHQVGIPAPRFYGHVSTSVGQSFDGRPLRTRADLAELVERAGIRRMCFKLVTGWGGRGFVKVSVPAGSGAREVVIEPEGHRVTLEELWDQYLTHKHIQGYICQDVVEQHPSLAELNPTSLNTVRTWMVKGADGRWLMRGAWLRMGVGAVAVDNGDMGGITALLDMDSGRLSVARDIRLDYRAHQHHPVTGAPIAGRPVPMWVEIQEVSRRTAQVFDQMNWLAIDIAVGIESPVVIEINEQPDPLCQLDMREGWGTLMKELARGRYSGR
jgi:hypothetical protein